MENSFGNIKETFVPSSGGRRFDAAALGFMENSRFSVKQLQQAAIFVPSSDKKKARRIKVLKIYFFIHYWSQTLCAPSKIEILTAALHYFETDK